MHSIDELIVSEIRRKNDTVLKDLYKLHYPAILKLIVSNSGSEQEARDVYQEAMIVFYERVQLPEFTLSCRIGTFLYAVARRLWLKRLTEKRKVAVRIDEPGIELPSVDEAVADFEDSEHQVSAMRSAMAQLGEPCSKLLEDYYYRQLSMNEITGKYGYTNADNAKNQKYKCLQRLKKLFFAGYRPEA